MTKINAKYIVINTGMGGEQMIIFSKGVQHNTFASLNPVSAGFVSFDVDYGWRVWGDSYSLGLQSREEDIKLVGYLNIDI